jgi:glyoxylase-like metal-dependent hydrolase (beta-lactamase superfamily II)
MLPLLLLLQTIPDRPPPLRTELAPGVHLFQTAPYGEVGLDGNTVAIVTGEGVVVFDANGTPAAAAAVLAEIRMLTTQPVRFLINSHWHWDHWYGNQVYRDAFPGLRIIAHAKTRALMSGPAIEFNRPGLETGLPGYLASLESRAAGGDSAAARSLAVGRFFLAEKRAVRHTLPDSTFTDRLTLRLGGREIQVLHLGRAVTPGDALLWLPEERVLLTGDLLVNPVTFALSGYPTEWLRVLQRVDSIDAKLLVTGHGGPLRDETLLQATMEVFRVLLREGTKSKGRGIPVDEAREAILPRLTGLRGVITRDDPGRNEAFRIQLVDWYLHRVYEELDGPLSDRIAPIPRH